MLIEGFVLVQALVILFIWILVQREKRKATRWHMERDAAVREREKAKLERDEFEQRCAFLTDRLNDSPNQ